MRHVDEIIVHCSDTPPGWMADASVEAQRDEITRWHVEERGWKGNGYHYIIGRSGEGAIGRDLDQDGNPWEEIAAHVAGRNARSIGICLIGGKGSTAIDAFGDHFTPAQDAALRDLIDRLMEQFPTITKVSGHNDYAAKACPGFKVDRWLDQKPPRRETPMQSSTQRAVVAGQVGNAVSAWQVIPQLDGTAQVIAICAFVAVGAALLWIARERNRKWMAGDR